MRGYQFRLLCQEMYRIHELIRTKKWNELVETVQLQDFTIDDIIFELNDYPGEISICSLEDFSDAIRVGNDNGSNIEALAQFWIDGEESDLSMECKCFFSDKKVKSIILERIDVF